MTTAPGSASRTRRSYDGLIGGLARTRALASAPDRLAVADTSVSGWNVGQHVEHLLLAAEGIGGWIERVVADPAASPASGSPSRTGMLVLVSGWIPRGRAPAPEQTVPGPRVGDDLLERFDALDALLGRLGTSLSVIHESECTTEHPLLGHFTPARWLRFLDIHQRHHEKIIRDILPGAAG